MSRGVRSVFLLALLLTGTLPRSAAQSGNPAADPRFAATLPTTSERLQQLQQQLAAQQQLSAQQKAQLEGLRTRVAQLGTQQKSALGRIDALSENIARLETARRALDIQIQGAQLAIRDLNVQITGTQARVDRLQQDVRELLVSLYRERSGRYLQLLSQASSLSDLLIRARYANISGQNNVRVVQSLKTETARLQAQLAAQATQKKQLDALQARQIAQLTQLQAQRQEQTALVAELRQNQAGQQALAQQQQARQAREAQTTREQQALTAQQQSVQNQQDQSQQQLAPLPGSVGNVGFPLPGGRVTSAFNASGPWTVLSGDTGAQAVAVAEGNVIIAAYYANLGWVVIVDHGALLSSSFGLLQPLVSVGQRVSRGQALGIVGGSPQFGPASMALQLTQISTRQNIRPPF